MAVLTLCDLLAILSRRACPSSVIHCRSVILLISKSSIFTAAANWTRLICVGNLFRIKSYMPRSVRWSTRLWALVEPVFQFSGILVRLVVQINAILFSGNNNVHYLLCLGSR